MSSDKDDLETAKVFLELALKSDETIQETVKRLTDKVKSIFTVSSALTPIVVGLGYFIIKDTREHWGTRVYLDSIADFSKSSHVSVRDFARDLGSETDSLRVC